MIALEIGDFDGIRFGALAPDAISACYVEAVEWADRFLSVAGAR